MKKIIEINCFQVARYDWKRFHCNFFLNINAKINLNHSDKSCHAFASKLDRKSAYFSQQYSHKVDRYQSLYVQSYLSLNFFTDEEPVVILVNQVTEQQAILQEQILKSYRGNEIIEQITKQKHEATRSVVYAVNSDERIEQELKEYAIFTFHLN